MGLRLDRLPEPGVELARAELGDGVALAVRPGARLRISPLTLPSRASLLSVAYTWPNGSGFPRPK